MSLYVDSSAFLKRYVLEPDSPAARELLNSDPSLLTARHTIVEVRRNLVRLLPERDARDQRAAFERDMLGIGLIELDAATCDAAASIAEHTGARALDALHLAAAQRAGITAGAFVTFDRRQAQAARSLGMTVLGA